MTIQNTVGAHAKDISEQNIDEILGCIIPFFNETNVVMYLVDSKTMQFVVVNRACEEFYGWNQNEFKSKYLQNINQKSIEHHLQDCNRFTYNTQHFSASGTVKNVEVYCSLVKMNHLDYWYEVVYDKTCQKLLENEMKDHYVLFEAILWSLSHEIRSSVARILGILDIYENSEFTNLSIEWFLKQIQESTIEIDCNIHSLTHNISKIKEKMHR